MARYQKKPVVIEAALFDGEIVGEPYDEGKAMRGTCPAWFPAVVRTVTSEAAARDVREGEVVAHEDTLWIGTLEGPHRASPGDMIIRGLKGEIYPCKPDIFRASYEPAR